MDDSPNSPPNRGRAVKGRTGSPPVGKLASTSTNSVPRIPPPVSARVASISRPPLERASSVPERGFSKGPAGTNSCGSSKNSIDKVNYYIDKKNRDSLSGKTSNRISDDSLHQQNGPQLASVVTNNYDSRASLEKFTNVIRQSLDRGINTSTSIDRPIELIELDEYNHPTIDRAITPPASPSTGGITTMFASNNVKGVPRRKLPSLKFKRTRMGSIKQQPDKDISCSPSSTVQINPIITVTVNDDEESMVSDYLSPDKNCKTAENNKIHFPHIGDDVSLYGTPKEELSPLKEVDSSISRSASNAATNYLKDQIISFFQPSDNKLAMKLFGNKNALMKEKMRQKAAGNWVIHPCSNFR